MNNRKNLFKIKKNITIFILSGIIYVFMEVIFTALNGTMIRRFNTDPVNLLGFSSIYMFFIGGFLGMTLGLLNTIEFIKKRCNMFFQSLIGAMIITITELLFGLIINSNYGIWDYRDIKIGNIPLNFLGQISLPFFIIWFFLSPLAFWFDDMARAIIYNENNGRWYPLLWMYKQLFNPKALNWDQINNKKIDNLTDIINYLNNKFHFITEQSNNEKEKKLLQRQISNELILLSLRYLKNNLDKNINNELINKLENIIFNIEEFSTEEIKHIINKNLII